MMENYRDHLLSVLLSQVLYHFNTKQVQKDLASTNYQEILMMHFQGVLGPLRIFQSFLSIYGPLTSCKISENKLKLIGPPYIFLNGFQ